MKLLPREIDKLQLHQAGSLAQKRLTRGLQLNECEVIALITTVLLELVRDQKHSLSELQQLGKQILGKRMVIKQAQLIDHISVEGTFRDGTKLITIHDPICTLNGDLQLALYASCLPIPDLSLFPDIIDKPLPQFILKQDPIVLNLGRKRIKLQVWNNGDRPIQIGSHYHFVETNFSLLFDRLKSYGYRLDIPSGTSVRFEPGERKVVNLVEIGGNRVITGGNLLATGTVKEENKELLRQKLINLDIKCYQQSLDDTNLSPTTMTREQYCTAYGPTTGDKVRLADTNLFLEIEKDYTFYGDECVFGGGKTIREGQAQTTGLSDHESLDLVITNAIIIDHSGIIKADIGIKNGYICGIGKAGNPDTMDSVNPNLLIGNYHNRRKH